MFSQSTIWLNLRNVTFQQKTNKHMNRPAKYPRQDTHPFDDCRSPAASCQCFLGPIAIPQNDEEAQGGQQTHDTTEIKRRTRPEEVPKETRNK